MFNIVYCRSAQLSIFFFRRHQTPTPKTLLFFYSMKMVIVTGRVLFWQIIKVIGHFRWVLFRVSTRLQSTLSHYPTYIFLSEWSGGGVIAPNTEVNRKREGILFWASHHIQLFPLPIQTIPYSCAYLLFWAKNNEIEYFFSHFNSRSIEKRGQLFFNRLDLLTPRQTQRHRQ